ncbi:hypothetical protein [Nocardia sp. MH4]|uniref:hypothetical protein n=1 Tax=Nocardia sp. MH4 TaxID=1768677 RepID=UPI001C500D91|nr:hypothetical protein [Nocardia sp. MH4]
MRAGRVRLRDGAASGLASKRSAAGPELSRKVFPVMAGTRVPAATTPPLMAMLG